MSPERSFVATVKTAGIDSYVEVPARVAEVLGAREAVLVKVASPGSAAQKVKSSEVAQLKRIAHAAPGGWFRTTLVPGPDSVRLYLDSFMRRTSGAGVGDRVRVEMKPEAAARVHPMPVALREALDSDHRAQEAWDALAAARRREILYYLNHLKTPDALERNVRKTISELTSI